MVASSSSSSPLSSMASFASNILFPHSSPYNFLNSSLSAKSRHFSSLPIFLHFQPQLFSFRLPKFAVSKAIRNPKFDFNTQSFDDDDDDDEDESFPGRRRRRRRRRKKQRLWWSDELQNDVAKTSILEQLVDNLWILQVFRSYGWFLPIILISFLVATGPKAFLMASGIPFGLSIVIFAFQKLLGWLEGSPKPRKKHKKRSKSGRKRGNTIVEEDGIEEEIQSGKRFKKRDFQSWVNRNNGSFYDSDSSSTVGFNSFGGWDELVREDETQNVRKPPQETERLERMMEKQKLSKSVDRDLPLLLKLLIAVFPFLASWTNSM